MEKFFVLLWLAGSMSPVPHAVEAASYLDCERNKLPRVVAMMETGRRVTKAGCVSSDLVAALANGAKR
jgi:hypothetical protein